MAKPYITTGETVRNFLLWGFALSLLVHLAVAPLLPAFASHSEDQTVEKVSMVKKVKVKVPTPPPPTPTPRPTPPPKAPPKQVQTHPQQQIKVNVVHQTSNNNPNSPSSQNKYIAPVHGSENGNPAGTGPKPGPPGTPGPPAAPPPPTPTPKPACAVPYQDATTVNAVPPDYPESAKELGLGTVVVQVEVTVGPTGSLQSAKIYQSANNMALDRAALSAARQSTYQPKIVNCEKVSGDYLFRATFDPNG